MSDKIYEINLEELLLILEQLKTRWNLAFSQYLTATDVMEKGIFWGMLLAYEDSMNFIGFSAEGDNLKELRKALYLAIPIGSDSGESAVV